MQLSMHDVARNQRQPVSGYRCARGFACQSSAKRANRVSLGSTSSLQLTSALTTSMTY